MTDDDLKEIDARANEATPGPWWHHYSHQDGHRIIQGKQVDWRECQVAFEFRNGKEDGPFLAHARTDIPALIAEVKTLRKHIAAHLKVESNLIDELDESEATQEVSTMNHNQIYEAYKRMREALRFYADKANWECWGDPAYKTSISSLDWSNPQVRPVGGYRARKALGEE